jgi:hypothetical protein
MVALVCELSKPGLDLRKTNEIMIGPKAGNDDRWTKSTKATIQIKP